ncbi:sulfotransferase 1C2-like [Anneissia japonica]|uniref:sulfotransferase 1C2-like n=1 Tax=Anneissia japonica TaxID=1529436 RepID=UPI00142574FA|nr:sulfotransferase 1C2-like [Anneissia japonica]
MRNPKDSAVSRFHFVQQYRFSEEWNTWDCFLQSFLSDDMPGGSWFDFNLAYWKHRNDKNFFITTYEDMKMDIRAVIEEVTEFLEHPVFDKVLEKLVEIASYSRMSKKFNGRIPSGSDSERFTENIPFKLMRKGKVGDWKNLLTVSQNEIFDKIYEKKMKGSDMKSCIKFEL